MRESVGKMRGNRGWIGTAGMGRPVLREPSLRSPCSCDGDLVTSLNTAATAEDHPKVLRSASNPNTEGSSWL
jgi:hypothetical protein